MEPNQTKHWYVLYTRPRAEKKALKELTDIGVEAYLPLQKTVRQWSDRKKKVEVVLIPSYIFVNLLPEEKEKVYESLNVITYVRFNRQPAIIANKEMDALKRIVDGGTAYEVESAQIPKGTKMRVISGSLKGLEGEFVDIANNKKLIIRISEIGYSLTLQIPYEDLQLLKSK